MVSNFERILDEITREAKRVAPDRAFTPESVVRVIMEIVEIEDRNRIKTEPKINQRVKGMIQDALAKKEQKGDT